MYLFFSNNIHNDVHILLANALKTKPISETNYEKKCSFISKTVPKQQNNEEILTTTEQEIKLENPKTLRFQYR